MMITINGKGVSTGVACGPLYFYRRVSGAVPRMTDANPAVEWARVEAAKSTAIRQLSALYDKALKEVGEEAAILFETHQMMLEDLDYVDAIQDRIENQHMNAEAAVADTGEQFAEMFAAMDDEYMKARAADVKDISNRLIMVLSGYEAGAMTGGKPVILVADDLAPSETVQLDKSRVLSFVTRHGSTNSHTAILARTMNIPALIGVDYSDDIDGKMGIVDGYKGRFLIDPSEEELEEYRKAQEQDREKQRLLQELKGKENVTLHGKKINLYANISGMTNTSWDHCIVSGSLSSMTESNTVRFSDLEDTQNAVSVGDAIVTSNISDKYLPGILIGYITTMTTDSNDLTKSGTLTPVVDFKHLQDVLIITQVKDVGDNGN